MVRASLAPVALVLSATAPAVAQQCEYELLSPSPIAGDRFGAGVAADDHTLVVRQIDPYALHVFRRATIADPWVWEGQLQSSDPSWGARFHVSGDTLAVEAGASVEVYRRIGGLWSLEHSVPLEYPISSARRAELVAGRLFVTDRYQPLMLTSYDRDAATGTWQATSSTTYGTPGVQYTPPDDFVCRGDTVAFVWSANSDDARVQTLDLLTGATSAVSTIATPGSVTTMTQVVAADDSTFFVSRARSIVVLEKDPSGALVETSRPAVFVSGFASPPYSIPSMAAEGDVLVVALRYDFPGSAPRRDMIRRLRRAGPGQPWVIDAGWGRTGEGGIEYPYVAINGDELVFGLEYAGTGGVVRFVDTTCEEIGEEYCDESLPNSAGMRAQLTMFGSNSIGRNDLRLVASAMPQHAPGIALASRTPGDLGYPGGSQGTLCLSGSLGRYNAPGQILVSDAQGSAMLPIDLTSIPGPTGLATPLAGETWHFQMWFRDANPGVTSNFTSAVRVQLMP